MEQKETEISLLNIYVASHSVLRHDMQPESGITYSHISLCMSQRELSRQQMDMNMKRMKTLKEQESFVMGCLKNLFSSQG